MSGERFDPLVEDIERELREALAIDPTPGFERQVLARIEARRAAASRWPLGLAAAAAFALATALGWMFYWGTDTAPRPASGRDAADVALPVERLRPVEAAAVKPPFSEASAARPGVALNPPPEVPAVEIIVPPDRARGIARLLALTRSGAVDEEMLAPVAPAETPATLEIAPLVVPSILPQSVQTGPPERGAGGE